MAKLKPHHIKVRHKPDSESTVQTGANTEILLDGKLLNCATFFKFEVHARKVAKVTIELLATVDLEVDVNLDCNVEPTDLTLNPPGKQVNLYTLSNYPPKAIAFKK